MRLLFYKRDVGWPRTSGPDVHTYYMMRAMGALGARVGLVSVSVPDARAVAGLDLELSETLAGPSDERGTNVQLRPLEERYRSYWGVARPHIERVGRLAHAFRADAVIVCGLEVLPMLGAVRCGQRVWYAADEWCWHHLSQVSLGDPRSWSEIRAAAVKGLYERAYMRRIDRVWVVSSTDARAMRYVSGVRDVDVLPNGVDTELYQPTGSDLEAPDSAVFWGRLDFGPNIQALEWFCRRVWPIVRQRRLDARFTIVGFNPGAEIRALAVAPGISLRPNVEDLRQEVPRHGIVVLPFVSGAGIKNKLLEAAAMGRPIVGTSRALLGLNGDPPVVTAKTIDDWVNALLALWADEPRRRAVGRDLRSWVVAHHDWNHVASAALDELARGRARPPDSRTRGTVRTAAVDGAA